MPACPSEAGSLRLRFRSAKEGKLVQETQALIDAYVEHLEIEK